MKNLYKHIKKKKLKLKASFSKSVFKLVNRQFLHSKLSFIFSVIFSLVLVLGLGFMNIYAFGLIHTGLGFMNVIVGIMPFQILQTPIQILPEAIIEFKRPGVLRKTNKAAISLAHRTTWLRSDLGRQAVLGRQ